MLEKVLRRIVLEGQGLSREAGRALVEYALILGVVSLVPIAAFRVMGTGAASLLEVTLALNFGAVVIARVSRMTEPWRAVSRPPASGGCPPGIRIASSGGAYAR